MPQREDIYSTPKRSSILGLRSRRLTAAAVNGKLPGVTAATASPDHPPTAYLRAVAARLRERPAAVIAHTLVTLDRWRKQGHSMPHRLEEWEGLLRAAQRDGEERSGAEDDSGGEGLAALLHALESDDAASARLRDFHPFHGLLTREERRAIRGPCGYRH